MDARRFVTEKLRRDNESAQGIRDALGSIGVNPHGYEICAIDGLRDGVTHARRVKMNAPVGPAFCGISEIAGQMPPRDSNDVPSCPDCLLHLLEWQRHEFEAGFNGDYE